jgi:hypothetical protein
VRLLAALTLVPALALAACGNQRSELGEARVAAKPVTQVDFPRYGIEVSVPEAAEPVKRPPPGVFRLFLGEPLVSAFAYRRKEEIPRKERALRAARRRLIEQVEKRDPSFELLRSRLTGVAGAKAVELLGEQTISHGLLRTRSVHVYKGNAEYVFELLAPPEQFERTDREVFEPLLRSLALSGRLPEPEKNKNKKKKQS